MDKNTKNTKTNRTNRTKNDKKKFLEIFEKKACHISNTCKSINIGRQTYYDWVNDDKEFAQAVDDVKESLNDDTEDALMVAIKDGNVTAIIFRLKTKCKDRGYIEKQELELVKPIDEIVFNGL